jgi:plastocyanin
MKKLALLLVAVLVGAVVMIAGCASYTSPSPTPSSSAQTSTASQNSISIKGLAFNPASLTIVKGASVTWTNDDSTTHTVTSDTGAFESGNLSPGNSFTHQFNDAGTFPYHCSIHTFMKGTITVQ